MFPADNEQTLWIERGDRLGLFLSWCKRTQSRLGGVIHNQLAARPRAQTIPNPPTERFGASGPASADRRPSRRGGGAAEAAVGHTPRQQDTRWTGQRRPMGVIGPAENRHGDG